MNTRKRKQGEVQWLPERTEAEKRAADEEAKRLMGEDRFRRMQQETAEVRLRSEVPADFLGAEKPESKLRKLRRPEARRRVTEE